MAKQLKRFFFELLNCEWEHLYSISSIIGYRLNIVTLKLMTALLMMVHSTNISFDPSSTNIYGFWFREFSNIHF